MVQVHVNHLAQAGIHQLHHQIARRQDGRLKGKTQIEKRQKREKSETIGKQLLKKVCKEQNRIQYKVLTAK